MSAASYEVKAIFLLTLARLASTNHTAMSSNVGLSTPRGSGTSGYVQKNRSQFRPRDSQPYSKDIEPVKHRQRQPDKDILDHDRKREIEVKVFELRDRLEDTEMDEDEIESQCDALRRKLQNEGIGKQAKSLKAHQVHEVADAKIKQTEKLRRALGISKDYEEGGHWRRQEEKRAGLDAEV